MATATPTPAPYSPVAEAERLSRLSAAFHLIALPESVLLRRELDDLGTALPAAESLDAMAVLLARDGWVQYQLGSAEGGWCLAGAACQVTNGPVFRAVYYLLHLMIRVRCGEGVAMPAWNDTPGRTLAEVLDLVGESAVFARSYAAKAVA
ncbi:DUF6197 family protein [Streptomyces sp. SGAir0957]